MQHLVGPYTKITLNLSAQNSTKEGGMLSPLRINVLRVGTFLMLRFTTSEGVKRAYITAILFMALTTLFFCFHSDGMQTVPPKIKVVIILRIQASNAYDANCRTRGLFSKPIVSPDFLQLVESCKCSRTTPLGFPILPLIKIIYTALCGLTDKHKNFGLDSSPEKIITLTTNALSMRDLQVLLY
jgi:hypothetical protein